MRGRTHCPLQRRGSGTSGSQRAALRHFGRYHALFSGAWKKGDSCQLLRITCGRSAFRRGTCKRFERHGIPRHGVLYAPDLSGFLRLFRYGYRHGTDVRIALLRELQLPLLRRFGNRLLAALAHLTFHVFPRLCLHSARRKSPRAKAAAPEYAGSLASHGTVARCVVELRALGALLVRLVGG